FVGTCLHARQAVDDKNVTLIAIHAACSDAIATLVGMAGFYAVAANVVVEQWIAIALLNAIISKILFLVDAIKFWVILNRCNRKSRKIARGAVMAFFVKSVSV